jgi:hypothetical protein
VGGNNDVITELFLPRGSLVSDIPAGDGKLFFYGVIIYIIPFQNSESKVHFKRLVRLGPLGYPVLSRIRIKTTDLYYYSGKSFP